jgi:hypothetical protein
MCKSIPKKIIKRRATQKDGAAKPIKTNTVVILSKMESCLTADITPRGIENRNIKNIAREFIIIVMPIVLFISVMTGSWFAVKETPKLSVTIRLSHS